MTLTQWLDDNYIDGPTRQAFRDWLGPRAEGKRSSDDWWLTWDKWLREVFVK